MVKQRQSAPIFLCNWLFCLKSCLHNNNSVAVDTWSIFYFVFEYYALYLQIVHKRGQVYWKFIVRCWFLSAWKRIWISCVRVFGERPLYCILCIIYFSCFAFVHLCYLLRIRNNIHSEALIEICCLDQAHSLETNFIAN